MALGGFSIPPWLTTRPADFAQASESGLNAGLQAAHIWAAAAQEQARLQESQRAQDMDNALKQEALQQKSIYEAQALAVDKAKNQAVASLAQAKLQDTQQKAALAAQQWTANQKRLAAQAAAQNALSQTRESDMEAYRKALLAKKSAVDPLEAQLAGLGTKPPTAASPGILSKVKDFFAGAPKKVGESPYEDGTYVTNKKDGKTYVIQNGLPVLVDDSTASDEEPPVNPEGHLPGDEE